jgi:hypothetical protein
MRALRSGVGCESITIRLKKKELPLLSMTIESFSKTGKRIVLTQDIPVRILIPETASQELKEPYCKHL